MLNQLEKSQESLVILYKNGRKMSVKEIYGISYYIPDAVDASRILYKLKHRGSVHTSNDSGNVTYTLTAHGEAEAASIIDDINIDLSKKYDARIAAQTAALIKPVINPDAKPKPLKKPAQRSQPSINKRVSKTMQVVLPKVARTDNKVRTRLEDLSMGVEKKPKPDAFHTTRDVVSCLKKILHDVESIKAESTSLFSHGATLTETNLHTLASIHKVMDESMALKIENARLLEKNEKLFAENQRIKENVSAFFSRTGDFTESVLNGGMA